MAYWQVRAQHKKNYIDEFLSEEKWALLSEEHKNNATFTSLINSIQVDEILFLVNVFFHFFVYSNQSYPEFHHPKNQTFP